MRILFTADLHGNVLHYRKLFSQRADVIIVGGDLAPKSSVREQEAFYRTVLSPMLPRGTILIMGNDDARVHEPLLRKICEQRGAIYLHGRRTTIGAIDFVGYACVNVTPFGLKDWEKWDTPERELPDGSTPLGVRSSGEACDLRDEHGSIEEDLEREGFTRNPRKTICVMHAPPYGTGLDLADRHVGSRAIRQFIERHQPFVTLHGHIHETVARSGRFHERLGLTDSYAPGNDHRSEQLAAILLDSERPGAGERILL